MAERRMFCKSIVESDAFMDMPAEAQMLYVHLNLAADDDGFCDKPRSVMRSCGASKDSMKILITKKFVLTFGKEDNFIVVIKHWRMNNYIRKDNYHETKYKEFMRELYYDENKSYSTNPGDGHKPCIQNVPGPALLCDDPVYEPDTDRIQAVSEPLTQDRIGKDRIGKDRLDTSSRAREDVVEPENDLGRVMSYYMDKINPTPSAMAIECLKGYTRSLSADVVLHALQIAQDERKTGWSYIHAILSRYERDGLKTLDAVLRDEQERNEQKAAPAAKPNQITGSSKSRFTGQELSSLLDGLEAI